MSISMRVNLVLVCLLGAPLALAGFERCTGGDGPVPFMDVSTQASAAGVIKTEELVKEFILFSGRQKIYYKSADNNIREKFLNAADDLYLGDGKGIQFDSLLIDPSEKYLSVLGQGLLFNTLAPQLKWQKTGQSARASAVSWSKGDLFSVEPFQRVSDSFVRLNYSVFHSKEKWFKRYSCVVPARPNEEYHLATGQSGPRVLVYRTIRVGNDTRLSTYDLILDEIEDPNRYCQIYYLGKYSGQLKGAVKEVIQFEGNRGFAVRTDDPEIDLLWDGPSRCEYFHIGSGQVLIPNIKVPVLATWGRGEGLRLIVPHRRARMKVLQGMIPAPMKPGQIAMSSDRKSLYGVFTPDEMDPSEGGYLFKENLPQWLRD